MKTNYYWFQVKSALEDFKRNKTRTVLASLGILIGVLSVVMLIALGLGLKNYISGQFEGLGTNLIIVFPGSGVGQGAQNFGAGFAGGAEFDERDLRRLERIGGAEYVVPTYLKSGLVETSENEEFGYVLGTNEQMFEMMAIEAYAGELLDRSDIQRRSKDVVLGYTLAENLFETPEGALGKTVRFGSQRFKVKGVADKEGDPQLDGSIIMSYRTTFGSINPKKTFFNLQVGADPSLDVEDVKADVENALLERYDEDSFSVSDQGELLGIVDQIFGVLNGVLIAIGSISLVVGGIGIMNIMYANVNERTKEIGIRRAIGATKKDILVQFITESVMLSLFGGLMGLLISALIVAAVRPFFPLALNAVAVIVAVGISTAIGVFFGVFPARRASNLTPIEAIRYE